MGLVDFVKDGLYGLRVLRQKPVFFGIIVFTLAVSIGATTAIFSVINGLLLRPLPYAEAARLVMVWQTNAERLRQYGLEFMPVTYGDFSDLKDGSQSFEQVAGLDTWFANLTAVENPERLYGVRASVNFFDLMRVQPTLGRAFAPDDERPDATRVVILSHDFWLRRFGGDREVLGRQLVLNDNPYTVIGVLPQEFRFTEAAHLSGFKFSERTDIWAPLLIGDRKANRNFHNLAVVGRLRPSVSAEQANEEVQAFGRRMAESYPDSNAGYGMKSVPLSQQVTGELGPVLLTLLAATVFVLIIACADLAILLLARSTTRRRELAVRLVLGASRGRLLRQLLAESIFLSLLGGLLGVLVAYFGTSLFVGLSPYKVLQNNPVEMDLRVLGFTLTLSVLTGVLFGILPARHGVKVSLTGDLKEGAHGSSAGRPRSSLQYLIAAQAALTVMLLIGAGLAVKSFVYLLNVDPGFAPERVLTMDVYLPASRYKETAQSVNFFRQSLDKIKALPGVEAVGMNYALPFGGVNPSNSFEVEGQPPLKPGDFQSANLGLVNPDYFRALGIPLLRGRAFTDQDTADSPPVAVIDERMARQFFPNEDPLGKRLSIADKQLLTIVGVARAVRHNALETKPRPYVYLPFTQRNYSFTSFAVRTRTQAPAALAASVREAVRSLDKDLPVANIRTLEGSYSEAIAPRRYSMTLLLVFAGLALLLTETGIYGVVSYAVEQRRREIGIRMALGAQPRALFWMFARQGATSTIVGLSVGLLGALALAQLMSSLVYGIGPRDAVTFASVTTIALVVTFIATYLPARRAAKVNPTDVLRFE